MRLHRVKIKRLQAFQTSKRRLLPCCWATAAAAAGNWAILGGATAGLGGAFWWWNKSEGSLAVIDLTDFEERKIAVAEVVGEALRTQGFLYIKSPLLTNGDLEGYLTQLENNFKLLPKVEKHTKDPKEWAMFERKEIIADAKLSHFVELVEKLELIKDQILESMELSLELDPGSLLDHHKTRTSYLRALHYFKLPEDSSAGNRCKEHSDYQSVTLLLQPRNSGLEIWDESSNWLQVDRGVEDGLLVVNIGGLLQAWSGNKFKATIHRVVGPGSKGSAAEIETWDDRYSIAYFTGPDPELELKDMVHDNEVLKKFKSVGDYVEWRCKTSIENQIEHESFPRVNPAAADKS